MENHKERDVLTPFIKLCKEINNPDVLELGAKQSVIGRSTLHKEWIDRPKTFVGTDFEQGKDVDFLADVHNLSMELDRQDTFPKKYDIILAPSVFEHFYNPFKAMEEISKSLKNGGLVFVSTHNCYPIHAYPHDYWRFTIESLQYLVEQAGLQLVDAAYSYPAKIVSEREGEKSPAFLLVNCYAKKNEV
jgi:SAM-dependent methyltransferase